jgi:hypothetical protein
MSADADPNQITSSVAVVAIRHDGRKVLYAHSVDRNSAELTVAALARIGLRAEISKDIGPSLRPGAFVFEAPPETETASPGRTG